MVVSLCTLPPLPHLKRLCLGCILASTLLGVKAEKKIQASLYRFPSSETFIHTESLSLISNFQTGSVLSPTQGGTSSSILTLQLDLVSLADVSDWVTSQRNCASSGVMGNGWSSGYTCQTMRKVRSNSHLPTCPECSDEQSVTIKRRISLSHNVASVLPGGQLMVAPCIDKTSPADLPKSEKRNGEHNEGSKPYEADDETEIDLSDFDIIKDEPFVRVREWLNSQNQENPHGEDSSDEDEITAGDSPKDIRMKDYDVISVPCSTKPMNSISSRSIGYHSECEVDNNREDEEEDKDSEFTVLHSSIGGLDWKDRDDLSSSCGSFHSAAVFLTYDVVEMIELRYKNVV